jgi:hypothetical protein
VPEELSEIRNVHVVGAKGGLVELLPGAGVVVLVGEHVGGDGRLRREHHRKEHQTGRATAPSPHV